MTAWGPLYPTWIEEEIISSRGISCKHSIWSSIDVINEQFKAVADDWPHLKGMA